MNKFKLMGLKSGQWRLIVEKPTYRVKPDTPRKVDAFMKWGRDMEQLHCDYCSKFEIISATLCDKRGVILCSVSWVPGKWKGVKL